MKIIIQRVTHCSVSVNGEEISSIGNGILVLLGFVQGDNDGDVNFIGKKILNVRMFDDGKKKWSKSVVDKDFEVMCVSQFTLCHKLRGYKLDFHRAMPPEEAKGYYEKLMKKLRLSYKPEKVKDGLFGAYMTIDLCNDGPVTIEIDSVADQPKPNQPSEQSKEKQ